MHARTVGKPCVDERTCEIDPPSQRRDEPLDEHEDLFGIREMDRGLLEPPLALDPDAPSAVDHHLGDALVAQQWRELAEAKQPIFEPALEQAELTRRDHQPLIDERLAQCGGKMLATRPAVRRFAKTRNDAALDASPSRDGHVASIAMSSASSSYALPSGPPSALGRAVMAAMAPSARGSVRNTSRPLSEVAP